MTRTFFETCQCNVRIFHFDLASEIHVRETLDNVLLAPLRNGVVESSDQELEGCVIDVFFPLRYSKAVSLVYFVVRFSASVELADVPRKK